MNTKTIKQLISEFHTRAEEEVTAARKAHSLHKRQNVQAPDNDSKKSSYTAETDAEETPKKKQIKSTPSTAKPPPSGAVGRAPKGTGIDKIKDLDNDELDYNVMWEVRMQAVTLFRLQSLPRMRNLEILGSLLMSHAAPQVTTPPDIQVAAILTARSPEADPEGDPKVGHHVGPAAPLLLVTRVHSSNRVCDGERSRDKDHRSDQGSYYPDDCDSYHPNYDRYQDDRFYDFDSRYFGWGYNRRYDDRGAYWSLPCIFALPPRSDDHHSVNLRDMHPWGYPGFRDRQDCSGSSDCKRNADNRDGHRHESSHLDNRDHHRERCGKSPSKQKCSQSHSPEYKE